MLSYGSFGTKTEMFSTNFAIHTFNNLSAFSDVRFFHLIHSEK